MISSQEKIIIKFILKINNKNSKNEVIYDHEKEKVNDKENKHHL
jgi:hypothetical protein